MSDRTKYCLLYVILEMLSPSIRITITQTSVLTTYCFNAFIYKTNFLNYLLLLAGSIFPHLWLRINSQL